MEAFIEEMRQDRKTMRKQWWDIANRLGTVAEDVAAPDVRMMAAQYFDCQELDSFSLRVMRRSQKDRKRLVEFDIMMVCHQYLFVNATNSTPRKEYVQDFADKLRDIFDFFPEYQEKVVVPIYASFYLSEPIVQKLTEEKIYAMALGGETMELLNYEAVRDES